MPRKKSGGCSAADGERPGRGPLPSGPPCLPSPPDSEGKPLTGVSAWGTEHQGGPLFSGPPSEDMAARSASTPGPDPAGSRRPPAGSGRARSEPIRSGRVAP